MADTQLHRIRTIAEYHQFMSLPGHEHPLISVIDMAIVKHLPGRRPLSLVFDFYSIALKRNFSPRLKYRYGQREYDFDSGVMFFISPGQYFSIETDGDLQLSGWMLLIHPDYLWNTPLAKKIKQYEYFGYSVNEALHASEKEEVIVTSIMQQIAHEYHSNTDKFSHGVIVAQVELLLTYAERFYERQFITRRVVNHQLIDRLEALLTSYFDSDAIAEKGIPTVQYVAGELNVSPTYLSAMLKTLTGQSTQQHIHDKLIDRAKERLSTTTLTVSEIAYELGFVHSQSFSKLFKSKTDVSPLQFRSTFG